MPLIKTAATALGLYLIWLLGLYDHNKTPDGVTNLCLWLIIFLQKQPLFNIAQGAKPSTATFAAAIIFIK